MEEDKGLLLAPGIEGKRSLLSIAEEMQRSI